MRTIRNNATSGLSRVRRFAVVMLAVAGVSCAVVAPSSASAAESIKIGVLAPMTGPLASEGEEWVRGATLAAEEINAAGGVAGYTFEIEAADIRDQVADAVISGFERLSNDPKVKAIITGYASPTNFEIDYMAEVDMPYMLAGGSAQTYEIVSKSPDDYPTVWSFMPSYDAYETELTVVVQDLEAQGLVEWKSRELAIISSDNPYSMGIYNGLKKSFGDLGWTVTLDEIVPFGEINDWRAILSKVRSNPPDIVINTDYLAANAATFMTQFLEDPTDSLVFIQYAPSVPEFLELTKEKSTGVLYNVLGSVIDTPKNPLGRERMAGFKERWGVESGVEGLTLYEMVHVYAEALREVGDPDARVEIGKAIGNSDRKTAAGRLKFDPATHLAMQGNEFLPLLFYQIWDGERRLIYPSQYATHRFQLPPWMAQ